MSTPRARNPSTEALLAIAVEAARQAGEILEKCAHAGFRVKHKNVINLVTDADCRAEQRIIDVIQKAFPSHRILAEERGLTQRSHSPYQWVIDPLDGTTNFAHGFPAFCVSIGVEHALPCPIRLLFHPP